MVSEDQAKAIHEDALRKWTTVKASRSHVRTNSIGSIAKADLNAKHPETFRKTGNIKSVVNNGSLNLILNEEIRKYMQRQDTLQSTNEKEHWIDATEIPLSNELHLSDEATVNLLPNKINERFKSVRSYLKTHYQLLREDAVSPLRDVIDKFRQNPDTLDDNDMSIYEKVHICGFTFAHNGIAARIKFSTKRAGRRIMWTASKRLVSGSLVALTPANDNFNSVCIVAIVAARPLELLDRSPPEVDIYFSSPSVIEIDPQAEFVMLEAKKGYFEAYRHTLRAIQSLTQESFPLSQHVIGTTNVINAPQYLLDAPLRSLEATSIKSTENLHSKPSSSCSFDLLNDWPERPQGTTLDDSQWTALNQILTKKLAIIQGPPGTGKTFVSKTALEVLVQNRLPDDPPIIVAAQTNHALDQLLLHISAFDPNYIRLGGRSTNSAVRKQALYEIRQREPISGIPGSMFKPSMAKLKRFEMRFGLLLSIFKDDYEPISCDAFSNLGIISDSQLQSLVNATRDWITSATQKPQPMQHWLHQSLTPFKLEYSEGGFEVDDAEDDLEFEQLNEIEAEHGVTDEEDIEILRGSHVRIFDHTTVCSPSEKDMTKAEYLLETRQDLWSIPQHLRGAVYLVMKQKAKAMTLSRFRAAAQEYERNVKNLKIGKYERDAVYLKRANVIGMTTTGLSKYRALISSLKPKIVLVEEAAEVIEGPVTAACMESVEHLILVGDHKQLQGHCSVQELENEPYFLNVSMFERLINLGMPYKTLLRQRRMNTEIRELVSTLYPNLSDHEEILTRQQMPEWGTGSIRSYFFHHNNLELKDQSLSTYNDVEARMVARFYRHLLRHGVPAAGITVLTFYNGQRKHILRALKNDPETNATYNIVKTVDSYQGEENEVIILSLVRNNEARKIGFLEIENRVCVALSRARFGLYLFGNGLLLAEKSKLWARVASSMSTSKPSRFGTSLPLKCVRHQRCVWVTWPEDFDTYNGGCGELCGQKIPICGHVCKRKCHPTPHDVLPCMMVCGADLSCGHTCRQKCGETCLCKCKNFEEPLQRRKQRSLNNTELASSQHDHRFADDSGEGFHAMAAVPMSDSKAVANQGDNYQSGPVHRQHGSSTNAPTRSISEITNSLMDLSTEEKISDSRSKFTQYFQPGIQSQNSRDDDNNDAGAPSLLD